MILAGPEAPSSFHQPTSVARGKGPSGKVWQAQTTRATKAAPAMRTKQTIFIAPPRPRLKRHALDSDQARQLLSFSVRNFSLAASLTQKWKQTATFTSRLRMPAEPTSEPLAPRFRLAQGGVRFGKQYSIGQRRSFHLASNQATRSKFASRMSSR